MKIENKTLIIKLITVISLGSLFGCGVTSSNPSSGNGAVASVDSKSMSPLDLVKMQNQQAGESAQSASGVKKADSGSEFDPEGTISELYDDLSSPVPAVRKKAESTLMTLVLDNARFLEELKRLENENPDGRDSARLILKNVEKTKAMAADEEYKREMAAIAAAEAAESN